MINSLEDPIYKVPPVKLKLKSPSPVMALIVVEPPVILIVIVPAPKLIVETILLPALIVNSVSPVLVVKVESVLFHQIESLL